MTTLTCPSDCCTLCSHNSHHWLTQSLWYCTHFFKNYIYIYIIYYIFFFYNPQRLRLHFWNTILLRTALAKYCVLSPLLLYPSLSHCFTIHSIALCTTSLKHWWTTDSDLILVSIKYRIFVLYVKTSNVFQSLSMVMLIPKTARIARHVCSDSREHEKQRGALYIYNLNKTMKFVQCVVPFCLLQAISPRGNLGMSFWTLLIPLRP